MLPLIGNVQKKKKERKKHTLGGTMIQTVNLEIWKDVIFNTSGFMYLLGLEIFSVGPKPW